MKIHFFQLSFAILILLAGCGYPQPTDSQGWEGNSIASADSPIEQETSTPDSSLLIQETAITSSAGSEYTLPLPLKGNLYHAVYPGGSFDFTGAEDDITPDNLHTYEENVGKTAAWVYFSNNWFNGRAFPLETARWIRDDGSIPFIRLMLRSEAVTYLDEPLYTLDNILNGIFDEDLRAWFIAARDFGTPLLVEYGTEVNGEWFSWNGVWNGGGETGGYGDPTLSDGPERFIDAYRHIIQLAREVGAENITWVFHLDDSDIPEEEWNRFEHYYPGDDWIDWIGVSIYGALAPDDGGCVPFSDSMDAIMPRLAAMSPGKPVVVLEFATDANNPNCDQLDWIRAALTELVSNRWPGVIGFSYWNENWENDDSPENNTVLRVQDSPGLPSVFQELVGNSTNVLGVIIFNH